MKVKPRVFVTRGIFDQTIAYLRNHVEVAGNATDRVLGETELHLGAREADGVLSLLTDRIDEGFFAACPAVRVVANFAVGYNNIDLDAASRRGVLVTNTPGVLTETTADFAWCLLLGAARRVVEADRFTREGRFTSWGPKMLLGHDVYGKTLGIIGMGRIGQAVARRARGFAMTVRFYDPQPVPGQVLEESGAHPVSLDELFRSSDFISIHVPLLEETRHLVDDAALRSMKPNCILVNTARGPVIDEKALVGALEAGRIAGAGLDVYEREPEIEEALLRIDRVVLAPHIASASHETRLRMCMMAAENLVAGLGGTRPPNLVNAQVWDAKSR
jgi:glyoxylate reductase